MALCFDDLCGGYLYGLPCQDQGGRTVGSGLAICLGGHCLRCGVLFLLRALVLGIPYLDDPETAYLNNIRFDEDTIGDGPASYYV